MQNRSRRVRAAIGVAVSAALALSSCTTQISGAPQPQGSAADDVGAGVYLRQQVNPGPAKTYEGVPTYDPCAILTMDLIRQAGFRFDPANEYHDERFTADGDHGTTKEPNASPEPASLCTAWPKGALNWAALSIEQLPYQDAHSREIAMNILQPEYTSQHGERQLNTETRGDMQIITVGLEKPSQYHVGFFWGGGRYWADLMVHTADPGDLTKPEAQILQYLTDQVAAKLAAGPDSAGQSAMKYSGPYESVPAPCDVYQAGDFPTSFHEPELGRVQEVFQMGERDLTADPVDGNAGHWKYVHTSCSRVNHQLIDYTATQQQLTVDIDTYDDEAGAAYLNMWNCTTDPKYQHPYGNATVLKNDGPDRIGDGALCFFPLGTSSPELTFKVGRHIVDVTSFDPSAYKDFDTASAVFETVCRQIAQRLAQYE